MEDNNITRPHSAAATWSGFIYQGRVALYHCLKLIIEDGNYENFNLQLDAVEDFSIVYRSGDEEYFKSIHQVKAVNKTTYAAYRDDFTKLENKKYENSNDEVLAYFHLAKKLSNEEEYKSIETNHTGIEIYKYEEELHCEISDIENKIESYIKECLRKFEKNDCSESQLKSLFIQLYSLIDRTVTEAHRRNQEEGISIYEAAYEEEIRFSCFVDILQSDPIDLDKGAVLKLMRYQIELAYQQFMSDCLEYDEHPSAEDNEKLIAYWIKIKQLNNAQLESFIQDITPHRLMKFNDFDDFVHNPIYIDEFKDAFFAILVELKESNLEGSYFGWFEDNSVFYPTTISNNNNERTKKRVCREIIETMKTVNELSFNADYLVTNGMEVDSIQNEANNISHSPEDPNKPSKIMDWKHVGLIKYETAKEKINGNDN